MEELLPLIILVVTFIISSNAKKKAATQNKQTPKSVSASTPSKPPVMQTLENKFDNITQTFENMLDIDDGQENEPEASQNKPEEAHTIHMNEPELPSPVLQSDRIPLSSGIQSRLSDIAIEQPMRLGADQSTPLKSATNVPVANELHFDYDKEDQEDESIQHEMLRGIIMAEILTRPQHRKPVWRK